MKKRNYKKFLMLLAIIPLIPILGYAAMHALVYITPLEDSFAARLIAAVAIIMLGLAIPYWIIKAGFFAAHLKNKNEKNITLKDLPKNEKTAVKVGTHKA